MSITLSVIIVSWNVKELLDRCLTTLRKEIEQTEVQANVWVVDNASSDQTATMVRQSHPWVHLDVCTENLGYVRGNNRVMKYLMQAKSPDYIWLLNPDTVIQPDTLRIMLDFFQTHPQAGLIGPQLQNPDGSLQDGAFRFPDILQPLFDFGLIPQRFYYTRWNGRYPAQAYAKGDPFPIDHPLGAAMMARSAAIREVGLLDEEFFMYCEEIDWAWRMRKAGWGAWMLPAAKVIHYSGASAKQAQAQTTAYLWESRARLYRKHHKPFTYKLVRWLTLWHFKRQHATSPEWEQAYQRIIQAWQV